MRQRIEPNAELPPLVLPGRVLNELCSHALETQPEECCGLVTGNAAERYRSVERCRNEMTMRHRKDPAAYPRDGREAFYMSEVDLLRARQHADVAGEEVTAVYHSHVGAGAYLSELDQTFIEQPLFPFPLATQLVIAVWERRVPAIAAFERDPVSGRFRGRRVEAARS